MKRITFIKLVFLVCILLICVIKIPKYVDGIGKQLQGEIHSCRTVSLVTLDKSTVNTAHDLTQRPDSSNPGNLSENSFSPVGSGADSTERMCEYDCIDLPDILQKNDHVDIRMSLGDGRDYTVLIDKCISYYKNGDDGDRTWLSLSESEIIAMASVKVDLELFPEARVYAVMNMSHDSTNGITYPVNKRAYSEVIKTMDEGNVTKDQYISVCDEELDKEREAAGLH